MKKFILDNLPIVWFILIILLSAVLVTDHAKSEDSFENTMKKIEMLEGNNTKVEYDKIQPIKDQYCFIKVEIKELDNGEVVKQEVVECADGRKAYDGPSYWELFAQFYYRDMFTPAYCRYYERPNHAYHKPGKVCLDKDGNWGGKKMIRGLITLQFYGYPCFCMGSIYVNR